MSTTATTAPIDVNALFATERAGQQATVEAFNADASAYNAIPLEQRQAEVDAKQLASFEARVVKGELVEISPGRYQSTEGWDRGEIWELRKSSVADKMLLALPEHGLDIDPLTGRARLYTATPAWHGLGSYIPGGTDSIDEVISLGGLDVPVFRIPVPSYEIPGLGTFEVPGKWILANGETGAFWGIVGKIHKNVEPRTSFEFMENLLAEHGIIWESAGLMNEGATLFVSAQVPGGVTVDADGVADFIRMYLVVQDTRDGSGSYKAMITPWAPRCRNTNRFALRDAVTQVSLRHTSGLPDRIEAVQKTLGLTVDYTEKFARDENLLAHAKTSQAEIELLLADIFTEKGKPGTAVFGARDKASETTRTAKACDRREADLMARIEDNRAQLGDTLYMVENVVTEHLDWGKVRTGNTKADRWNARIEASLAGADDGKKARAHERLLLTVANRG